MEQLVIFELDNHQYGLGIHEVREILRVTEITPIPDMPMYFKGVINLRGAVVPILNLRQRLGLQDKPLDQNARIILTEADGCPLGLIVDRVLEVNTYESVEVERPEVAGLTGGVLSGIVKKENVMWLIVDLKKIA